jgi:hypothetical protein
MTDELVEQQPDRRSVLKKAGIVGVGIWTAPAITSISSPAFATGSPQGADGCIVLDSAAHVSLTYTANACNTLEFGLVGGQVVCTNCANNSAGAGSADLGDFPAGATLRFYFEDNGFGSCCTFGVSCNGRYECGTGTTHIGTQRVNSSTYKIYFVDAGCNCDRVAQDAEPQAGPTARNIEVTVTLS